MNLPGFTAENSVKCANRSHRGPLGAVGEIGSNMSTVVPALFTIDGPFHIGWCCEGFWVLTCYPCYSY
jgi:hypothetical protein